MAEEDHCSMDDDYANRWYVSSASTDPIRVERRQRRRLSDKRWFQEKSTARNIVLI